MSTTPEDNTLNPEITTGERRKKLARALGRGAVVVASIVAAGAVVIAGSEAADFVNNHGRIPAINMEDFPGGPN